MDDGVIYQTYSTTGRGVEFLMSYYPILDRVASGRDESDGFQLWIRRHDEYEPKPAKGPIRTTRQRGRWR